MRSLSLVAIALFVWSGCAASSGDRTAADVSPDTITAEEIAAFETSYPSATAYDLVDRLHRTWLFTREAGTEVHVYQGSQYLGNVDALRQLQTAAIVQIERLDSRIAQARYGRMRNHSSGALVVTFR